MKILLNKNRGKRSSNQTMKMNIGIRGNNKLLPLEKIATTINEESVYQSEREKCTKVRLITTINPICSNVLNNKITEVVYREGDTEDCRCLNMGEPSSDWLKGKLLFKKTLIKITQGETQRDIIYNAIRDTQLTRNKDWTYHCGLDIFNNHILRSQTFKTVCLPSKNKTNLYDFNTIDDMMRTIDGTQVMGYKNDGATAKAGVPNINLHLYTYDDILSFQESINQNYIEENGWFGFKNASKMNAYSGVTKNMDIQSIDVCNINSVINNKLSCEFIHLAPEKDLFSFTPKYNKYQNRFEKNWHYYITYPSSATTEVPYIRAKTNSLKAIYFNDKFQNSNGTHGLKIYGITKHGLNVGDIVNIYNGDTIILQNSSVVLIENEYDFVCDLGSTVLSEYNVNINTPLWRKIYNDDEITDISYLPFELEELSDLKIKDKNTGEVLKTIPSQDRIISITKNGWKLNVSETTKVEYGGTTYYIKEKEEDEVIDESTIIIIPAGIKRMEYDIQQDGTVIFDEQPFDISYKQVVNGEEVEYYVRIFSKLPNWKFAKEKPTEFNIYKQGSTMIADNQGYGFNNEIGTLGFAKNIYNDDITQIVFNEDIDINGLKDNLGRPLTDIYLTILKNNKGYKEWYYHQDNWKNGKLDKNGENIEFSHMFGKLNCGFNLSPTALVLPNDKCVGHIIGMNNLFEDNIGISGLTNINIQDPDQATDEIFIEDDVHFYGDLCCLSRVAYAEKTIDDAMFRFNTSQRELGSTYENDVYNHISYDEITKDDYDYNDATRPLSKTRSTINKTNSIKLTTKYTIPTERSIEEVDGVPSDWEDFNPCVRPEGYCYKAHYKIPIKTYSQELESQYPKNVYLQQAPRIDEIMDIDGEKVIYGSMKTNKNNYFEQYDVFVLYDDVDDVYYHGEVLNITNLQEFDFCLYASKNPFENINFNRFRLLRKDATIPKHALLTNDGTCRYVWRWILPYGDDKFKTDKEYPFTNGAFYINQNINFYLKRQDPDKHMDTYRYLDFDDEPFNIEANKTTKQNDNTYKSEGEMTC